jgi:hypothetical protein
MVNIVMILSRMEQLEGGLAELYEWLSGQFPDSADVSGFFFRLSLDEKAHRDLVRYQLRMVRGDRKLFPDVEGDLSVLDTVAKRIKQFRDSASPTLQHSLRFAVEVESSIAEHYVSTILGRSNPAIAGLIENLCRASGGHLKECREMAGKHGA